MPEKNTVSSDFQIESVILMNTQFERVNNVVFDESKVTRVIDILVDVSLLANEQKSIVKETLTYTQTNNETGIKEVFIEVVYLGVFKELRTNSIGLEKFSQINAPAIIYPFAREHMHNISLKAALGQIHLNPFDFTQYVDKVIVNGEETNSGN